MVLPKAKRRLVFLAGGSREWDGKGEREGERAGREGLGLSACCALRKGSRLKGGKGFGRMADGGKDGKGARCGKGGSKDFTVEKEGRREW